MQEYAAVTRNQSQKCRPFVCGLNEAEGNTKSSRTERGP